MLIVLRNWDGNRARRRQSGFTTGRGRLLLHWVLLITAGLSVSLVNVAECADCATVTSPKRGLLAGIFCRSGCENSSGEQGGGSCLDDFFCWCRQKEYDKYLERHHSHPQFHYPISSPFCSPTYGYYETCWRKMPSSVGHCYPNCSYMEDHQVNQPGQFLESPSQQIPAVPPSQPDSEIAPVPEAVEPPKVMKTAPVDTPAVSQAHVPRSGRAALTGSRPLTSVKVKPPEQEVSHVKTASAVSEWRPTAIRLMDGICLENEVPDDPRLQLTPITIP